MAGVVVVRGVHEHGVGHGWLYNGAGGRGEEAGNRLPAVLVHQSTELTRVVRKHGLCRMREREERGEREEKESKGNAKILFQFAFWLRESTYIYTYQEQITST